MLMTQCGSAANVPYSDKLHIQKRKHTGVGSRDAMMLLLYVKKEADIVMSTLCLTKSFHLINP